MRRNGFAGTSRTLLGSSNASGSTPPRLRSSRRSCGTDMLYPRIPAERLGVLVGPDGLTQQRLRQSSRTRIAVDSVSGEVTIDETGASDPVLALKARDIVQAMARGFSEDRAFRLLDEDAYLEILDIKDFAHSKNRVAQIRARLIGTRGKTRRIVEERTDVDVSVWGHSIALIAATFETVIA